VPEVGLIVPVPAVMLQVTDWPLRALPLASVTFVVIVVVLSPSRRMLLSAAETATSVATAMVIVAIRELPRIAVTVAEPAVALFSVVVALPALFVVAVAVMVPSEVAKLTDFSVTGLPVTVSVAVNVIVAASVPLSTIVDLFVVMFRLIPRRVMEVLPELPPAVAWTVPLLLSESAASAV